MCVCVCVCVFASVCMHTYFICEDIVCVFMRVTDRDKRKPGMYAHVCAYLSVRACFV